MVQKVAFARAYVGIIQRFVYFQRLCFYPFTVLPIQTFLGYLAYVYFGVEISCKGFVVVACITINNIQIVNLVEHMLCCVCGEYARNARVEATTENSRQSCFFKLITVCPLPAVFKMCFVARFIICRIQITGSSAQACIHYC